MSEQAKLSAEVEALRETIDGYRKINALVRKQHAEELQAEKDKVLDMQCTIDWLLEASVDEASVKEGAAREVLDERAEQDGLHERLDDAKAALSRMHRRAQLAESSQLKYYRRYHQLFRDQATMLVDLGLRQGINWRHSSLRLVQWASKREFNERLAELDSADKDELLRGVFAGDVGKTNARDAVVRLILDKESCF